MNKDVIYIEPEDDITDIITKIENSKEKIVALVPPKKAGVFRSIVNIKLIAKVGFTADKTIVLVTTDPSIVKLAGATKIPVTKNLQTAPTIPSLISDDESESTSKEELVEKKDGEVEAEEKNEKDKKDEKEEKEADESSEKDDEKEDKKDESKDKADSEKSKKDAGKEKTEKAKDKTKKLASDAKKFSFAWFAAHKGITIGSIIGVLLVVIFLVWAFAIAPAVTITVGVRTTSSNFSKSATFTKKLEEENINEGKFYLVEKKLEKEASKEFEATGQKNVGEKAKGSVVVYAFFSAQGTVGINAGEKFTIGELSYTADANTTITWDGTQTSCENTDVISGGKINCKISGRVSVTAVDAGEKYNIAASSASWKTTANVSAYTDSAMAGGTDQMITVVSQEDLNKAKEDVLTAEIKEAYKTELLESLADDDFKIESSYRESIGDAVSTPAIGEEVKDGIKPKVTVKVTETIYLIDKTKVEEYITNEAKLSENYKIYKMENPFIENFVETSDGFTGKIKTSYISGPKVTENDIIELVKGKGLGDAQHDLASIDGINGSKIRIDKSYPWVMSVPGDTNKITVILDTGISSEE